LIVIVYGHDGSGPGHWQRWLHQELEQTGAAASFPELPDAAEPRVDAWVAALTALVTEAAAPVTFVCHSLGCWAVDHLLASHGNRNVHAALLVAPPSPFLLFEPVESFLPPPRNRAAWGHLAARSLLVGSDDDDFTSRDEFASLSAELGVPFHFIAGAGHINVASGYGPWPFALQWLRDVGALRS
jgi:hypothetical protein